MATRLISCQGVRNVRIAPSVSAAVPHRPSWATSARVLRGSNTYRARDLNTETRMLNLHPDAILTPEQVCEIVGVSAQTLAQYPMRRCYLSRKTVRYFWRQVEPHVEALREWEARRTGRAVTPAPMKPSEPPAAAVDPCTRSNRATLYVLRNPHTGLVKIGMSKRFRHRLTELEYASGVHLEVLHTKHASARWVRNEEARLHLAFAAARQLGEWFTLTPDLRAWLDEQTKQVA